LYEEGVTDPSRLSRLRAAARAVRDAQLWRPSHLALHASGYLGRRANEVAGFTDGDHLLAAAAWLARAQDATGDGGVAGRYRLSGGWSSSYPETTGYLVPTFLALDAELPGEGWAERARRAIEFLLGVQLDSGAFPGLEIAENRTAPSTFNSAQILNGLTAWHRVTRDDATLAAARRAADWLVVNQDPDGAWRKHLYGSSTPYAYMSHASCWLAEFGSYTGERGYLDAAGRHLEWVLQQVDESTGWINFSGFGEAVLSARSAVTHTIAYTIWGVLYIARELGHAQGLAAARRAARAVARRLELSKWLPGRLDAEWKGTAPSACLTGNAQMALIWFELHRLEQELPLVSAAFKALDLVKQVQPMRSANPAIRGGIPGSDPVDGAYVQNAIPNWAAKFFIDALLAKRATLESLALPGSGAANPARIPASVPTALPVAPVQATRRPRVVLIADDDSPKVEQFHQAWKEWGFAPDAVVVRPRPDPPIAARLRAFAREHGLAQLALRFIGVGPATVARPRRQGTIPTSGMPVRAYCAAHGFPVAEVESWTAERDLTRVRSLQPDLLVYAGAGIMRAPLLAIPALGTLNAHMGILPPMRGMNVAEWSVATGEPVGCTVHLIDPGIDTGDILMFTPVDAAPAASVDHLRQLVDRAQIGALGDVVRWCLAAGTLPPRRGQTPAEGRQYFAMHDELRARLDQHLAEQSPG
jgi:folate-dependent phosphoribosylglycinamide formyltransferase PurN